MKGILIVDHGSQKAEANDMLRCMANLIQTMAGTDVVVRYAHMELADPTIAEGFAACVNAGATDVTAFMRPNNVISRPDANRWNTIGATRAAISAGMPDRYGKN